MNQREKMKYEEPMVDICVFDATDIITTSNGFAGDPVLLYAMFLFAAPSPFLLLTATHS